MARITIEPHASAADIAAVEDGLLGFNVARIGEPNEEPVHIFVRDGKNRVVGGLLGHIRWQWLYVGKLWVDDAHRGKGHGGKLMAAAEKLAKKRKCLAVCLDTFEYQARPFYEKLGYTLFGTLDGYPPGYRQYYLMKRLSKNASD